MHNAITFLELNFTLSISELIFWGIIIILFSLLTFIISQRYFVKTIDNNETSVDALKAKHQWIFENIYDIYFEVSLDFKISFLSKSFEKVTKYKIENVIGKPIGDFYKDTKHYELMTNELFTKGKINNFEIKLSDYNNEQLDCLITVIHIKDKNNRSIKFCGIIHDITKSKKTELLILESEKRYKSLVDLSPNPIFVIQDKKFVFGNPATFELLKCKNLEAINKTDPLRFIFKKDREVFINYIKNIPLNQNHPPIELRIVNLNNEVINVLSHAIIIKFEEEVAYLFVMQEITKIKHYEKELIKAKAKAEESDRLKSSFLANMSHEIRTPLNGIIGFANLIRKPSITKEKLDNYTQIIQSASHQLLGLINDIIDISKIEAGQMVVNNEKLNINTIMDEMYTIYLNQAEKKGIELHFEKELSNDQAELISDETKIKQIFNNLLNNALKFTEKGIVTFKYRIKEHNIEFVVSDTGIGIPDDSKTAVFERFRQLDTTDSRRFGGTGLGLSICKALVDMMSGQIKVENNFPQGTVFTFSLPYIPVKKMNEDSFIDSLKSTVPNWKGKTILIAEDEETNFFFLEEIIEETHAKIIRADNGLKAIEIFNENPDISLALLDIKMPEMDGFAVLKHIKKKNPYIPVIAQTAYAMSNEKQKVYESGFNNYLSKPIDRLLFYKILNNYLK